MKAINTVLSASMFVMLMGCDDIAGDNENTDTNSSDSTSSETTTNTDNESSNETVTNTNDDTSEETATNTNDDTSEATATNTSDDTSESTDTNTSDETNTNTQDETSEATSTESTTETNTQTQTEDLDNSSDVQEVDSDASICKGETNLLLVPQQYQSALAKFGATNNHYLVNVCTENVNGVAVNIVVESLNIPEHESSYFESDHEHFEAYDYDTNQHKYADVYDGTQRLGAAGQNKIGIQQIIMKFPLSPVEATNKTATRLGTIGLALNGVSFFNEAAAPGDEITDELFTFDQCSGHPQGSDLYHYHVDPVCLIRDLGGEVTQVSSNGYDWIEDAGTNADLLVGFLRDGFPVYGPVGSGELDCNGDSVPDINEYNGHTHCTDDFAEPIFHYHVKTANHGGTGEPILWISNEVYFGQPGDLD